MRDRQRWRLRVTFDLSEVAQRALESDDTVLVSGGPGSGKTTLSLLKAQSLVPSLKPGQEILFLSFSRAAVRQVEIRCKDVLTGDERKLISVRTYHSFSMEVLRSHGRLLTGNVPSIIYPGPEAIMRAEFSGQWTEETKRLASDEGRYAFNEFAAGAARLIEGSDAVASLIASKYPVVILDEFQDTDDSQWALVQALSPRSRLIFLADPDQRIFDYDPRVDPERLNQLRSSLSPAEFELLGENHRSPDAGVLDFANAVLLNKALPVTKDVNLASYWPKAFESTVHAAVIWMFSQLRKEGIHHPSVAVLARTNSLIGRVSGALSAEHTFNKQTLRPVDHDVLWDAELTAAAAMVVASVLEWSSLPRGEAVGRTLARIADYFDTRNANTTGGNKSARDAAVRFRTAAGQVRTHAEPRPKSAKALVAAFDEALSPTGLPQRDWIAARERLEHHNDLSALVGDARFIRLFRATDEIGGRLTALWDRHGSYRNATDVVKKALEAGKVQANQREPRGCVLMNMHKAKGKEFDGVVIVEGYRTSVFFDPSREKAPFESSRRLLRVAITRARHRVAIVRPAGATALVSPLS